MYENRTIINWGSYDIDNFGDLLFPFIVNSLFKDFNVNVIHASPTGRSSIWKDSIQTVLISEALMHENIFGFIIGGGNLISWTKSSVFPYNENDVLSKIVHPSFFLIPYILHQKYGIPFAFNFVGVSKPIPVEKRNSTQQAIDKSCYVSCRDKSSYLRLKESGIKSNLVVGIDSAITISSIFPKKVLLSNYYEFLEKKYNIPKYKKLVLIYVKKRYFKNEFEELRRIVKQFKNNGLHPIFMPLALCFEDDLVFENDFFSTIKATVINRPERLFDILSIIAKCEYYIGSSLHGAIASISFLNKIIIIADEEETRISKFSGFVNQLDLSDSLFKNWKDACKVINKRGLYSFKGIEKDRLNYIKAVSINNWNKIYNSFVNYKNRRSPTHMDESILRIISNYFGI